MGFGGLGPGEIIMIFLVVLLLFGAKRLPEIGSSLGKGIREFKGSLREIETEIKGPPETPPQRTQSRLHASQQRDVPTEEPRRLATSAPPQPGAAEPPAEAPEPIGEADRGGEETREGAQG